ncbi:zinc-binding dehydrogenase [Pseudonocardia lacus]|uniref:zinc-binding dehydrogenase n=1 Tax=Pseudonocardia lacus TaxID=2835865 RepID=UPI001BDCB96E|nr:zinc-binding dehydrogenase [Pseudonocardia lacus]
MSTLSQQPVDDTAPDEATATMRAGLLTGPARLTMVDAPAPQPDDLADGEVLLRVLAGGICGSDLPAFRGTGPVTGHPAPVPGGSLHEVVGEVLASRDTRVRPGSRVVGWASRFDGLAERVVTRGLDVHEYDPALPPTTAVMLQPLACVLDALERVPRLRGERVAVIGQGSTGLLFSHIMKARGAAHVTGVDLVDRGDLAALYGVDEAVHAGALEWAQGVAGSRERLGVVVEAVGHQISTFTAAVQAVGVGGQVYCFGIPDDPVYPFPLAEFLRKSATLTAGATSARRVALDMANAYLAEHPALAEHYVTHTFAFEEAQRAFEKALVPAPGRVKVVIDAPGG